jgi:hypothetical protein
MDRAALAGWPIRAAMKRAGGGRCFVSEGARASEREAIYDYHATAAASAACARDRGRRSEAEDK